MVNKQIQKARKQEKFFKALLYVCAGLTILIVVSIIGYILYMGLPNVTLEFLTGDVKNLGRAGGILPIIINTVYLIALGLLFSVPISIMAAIYLNEYAKKGRVVEIIKLCTENLAGIPSVIFGLFGFLLFGRVFGLGWSLLNGSITVAIVIMPTLIRTTQEALLTVPDSYREGSLALGATKWKTIYKVVLPSALSGIFSGVALSMGRIIGETAALYLTLGSGTKLVSDVMQSARSLALHLYLLVSEGISSANAYATAAVLIIVILILNLCAALFTYRMKKKLGVDK